VLAFASKERRSIRRTNTWIALLIVPGLLVLGCGGSSSGKVTTKPGTPMARHAPEPRGPVESRADAGIITAQQPAVGDANSNDGDGTDAGTCHIEATTPTEVEGVVVRHCAYGPPNFGEQPKTDRKEGMDVLVLDRPLAGLQLEDAAGTQCVENITMFHVATLDDALRKTDLVGSRVKLSVEEFTVAETGHHHSRVVLWYNRAEIFGPSRGFSLRKVWPRVKHDFLGKSCAGYPR
jgi:hypothetical protein